MLFEPRVTPEMIFWIFQTSEFGDLATLTLIDELNAGRRMT